MAGLLIAAALAAAAPPLAHPLGEAAHAIEAGRLDQARIMIGNAIKAGASGDEVERLLADLAFAKGEHESALARYQELLAARPGDSVLAQRAGIAALKLGKPAQARHFLEIATAAPGASWRAWNALGAAADHAGDWEEANAAYEMAMELAPDRAEVANNYGWSLLVRGLWSEALELLEHAAALDPRSTRIANNLELARAAVAEDLPRRRAGESDEAFAARLNDAGVIARLRGDTARAIAAFARAIEVRSHWFERAANNLAIAENGK